MTDPVYFGLNTPDWWEDYFESGGWAAARGGQDSIDHMNHVLKVLADNDIVVADKEVLDVGCALGEGSQVLYEAGASLIGADFSLEAIHQCRLRYPEIGFIHTDIREIRGWYDIIIANHILEHMGSDCASIISGLREVCDILVISVPVVRDYNPDHKGVHTGQVKSAYDAHPPTILKERVAIWMD